MPQTRTIMLSLLCFTGVIFGQTNDFSRKEVIDLTDKADKFLNEYKFKESLFFSREALSRAIAIKDDYLIATAYNTIAGNYDELSDNDKAILNYKKALFYASKTDNDSIKGWLNNNLGNIYFFEKNQYQKGSDYYKIAIQYAEKTKDTARLVFIHQNLAWGNFDINDFVNGYQHLEFVNKHYAKFDDYTSETILKMLNGVYYGHVGSKIVAENYFQEAIALGKKQEQVQDLSYVYEEYSRFLRINGDYKNAYEYLSLFVKIKDKIYDVEKLKSANIEGVNFEMDEYKRAIYRIEREKKIQEMRLETSRTTLSLFIVGMAVLLVLIYTLYKGNRYKKQMNLELQSTNEKLRLAKEKAEEASQLKSQFVSTISHELRTPLYGVVGITNMILDEHKELAGSPHLNSLKFSAKYLLALVNDILQINKIEENRLTLENLTFNVYDEIYTIKNSLQFIAVRNNNKLTVEIDTDIPEFVIGDKLRLAQVFMNLVSNALKFTKNGEVNIKADLAKVEGKMHFLKFTVQDNGIGIAKQDQEKIFEKFVQIERRNDDYQGTGLGLSIVKRLIAVFDSELYMESTEHVGTTFTFTIAFEVDPDKTVQIINEIEVDMSSSQIFKILIVEDNKINQIVTKKIMESNNYTCQVVDDGYGAIAILEKTTFDAILMDINMPGIDGFETTRRIRKEGIQTPIIALTAFGKDEVTEEAISSGMNDIIIKPFDQMKLFRIITELINKHQNVN